MLRQENSLEEKLANLAKHFAGEEYLQEDASLYIAARGSLTAYSSSTFDLEKELQETLLAETSRQKVALILGESGSGKSMFGQSLVQKLAQTYLNSEEKDYLPLFISLPILPAKHRHNIMQETLHDFGFNTEDIEYVKQKQKFFVVLDAYDEIHIIENLYRENRFDQWQIKLMISCRTNYLGDKPNYKSFFIPFRGEVAQSGLLKEIHVAPFSPTEINSYIEKYLTVKQEELETDIEDGKLEEPWLKAESYQKGIKQIPNLEELITTPFLLRIAMEVLPEVMREYEDVEDTNQASQMTHLKLYDAFITRWFVRQEERLMGLGIHPGISMHKPLMDFAIKLAKQLYENNLTQVTYYEESLFEKGPENEWDFFFSNKFIAWDKSNQTEEFDARKFRIACCKACPLRQVGKNQYGFIHASLIDYFVERNVFDKMMKDELYKKRDARIKPLSFEFCIPPGAGSSFEEKEDGQYLSNSESEEEDPPPYNNEPQLILPQELNSFIIPYYQLQRGGILGSGGFGIVYRGKYKYVDVAIKRILSFNLNDIEELNKEAMVMAQLHHPNTVRLMGVSFDEGSYYMVMEYLEKGSLTDLLVNEPLSWQIKYQIGQDVGAGLAYLHDKGVVHCDLKGANIFLDSNYRAKVGDYGISVIRRLNASGNESFGAWKGGSYAYLAPEIIDPSLAETDKENARNTKAADVYAYGVVLWELGACKVPFKELSNNLYAIAHRVVNNDREEISADTPSSLAKLIKWCWEPKASERPTIDEAVVSLEKNKEEALCEAEECIKKQVAVEQKELTPAFPVQDKISVSKPEVSPEPIRKPLRIVEPAAPHQQQVVEIVAKSGPQVVNLSLPQIQPVLPQVKKEVNSFASRLSFFQQKEEKSRVEALSSPTNKKSNN